MTHHATLPGIPVTPPFRDTFAEQQQTRVEAGADAAWLLMSVLRRVERERAGVRDWVGREG